MQTADPTRTYSAEEFEELSGAGPYELVDGILRERTLGARASFVAGKLFYALTHWVYPQDLGFVLDSECGYKCFPHRPKTVRKPDLSFIRMGRLPGNELPLGNVAIPPDLAVEVVSPNDLYEEVDDKVHDYLQASIPLIWVVTPRTRSVLVHRVDGSALRLAEDATLKGELVLPGFACPLREIFPAPPKT